MASASASPDLTAYLPRIVDRFGAAADGAARPEAISLDGTLVFADLSGFTRIGERLDVEGREGAEQLTSVVNRAFAALLGPALLAGGDVVSFGGDSASIVFDGDGHADRAVRAAAAMQTALDELDSVGTVAGPVRMRMSVGIASGELTVALLGDEQHAVVLVGPTLDAAVALESHADATKIWASPAVVATVPDAPWAPLDASLGAELRWRRATWADDVPALPGAVAGSSDASPWLSAVVHRQLTDDASVGEFRRTVSGFVRAAPLATGGSLETVVERARAVAVAVERAANQWGVCWLAADVCERGVTFLLTAGAPQTSEDDVERMHQAMASIMATAPSGSVQAGIEVGVAFANDIGHPARRCWTVMGDCVNVAARLATAAEPGQVLSGPAVTAVSRAGDRAVLVGRQEMKGRRAPIEVFQVPPVSLLEPMLRPSAELPFVGREREQATLQELWAAARRGSGAVVDIVGEPGIGKTRLLQEFEKTLAADGDDPIVSVVRTDAFHASIPFAAIATVLRTALGIEATASPDDAGIALRACLEERAPHLAPWTPLIADAALATAPMTEAVERLEERFIGARREAVITELLETVTAGPWLLVVDDVQWVDASSRGLLAALADLAVSTEWLVCCSRRPSAQPLVEGGTVLELDWLGPEQATQLAIASADPTPLSDEQLARVIDAAAGNPLFLEQLAAHVATAVDEVPDTIERLIASRLDTLEPGDRQLLRDISVVGSSAPFLMVARLLHDQSFDHETFDDRRWESLRSFVDLAGLMLRFRSDLIRAVAEDGLPFARRRALHRAMADIIQSSGDRSALDDVTFGRLAVHLLEAGDAAAAWPVAVEAAGRARRRGALAEAGALSSRALSLRPKEVGVTDDVRAAVHEDHAQVCVDLGRLGDGLDAYAAASRLRTDAVAQAWLCSRRAMIEQLRGEYGKALRWGTKGLGLLDGDQSEAAGVQRAKLLLDQAGTRHYQGKHPESLALAEAAAAEAAVRGDRLLDAEVDFHLEMIHSALADGEARVHGEAAVAAFEELQYSKGLGSALVNLGVTATSEGRWTDAVACYERASEVILATGNVTQAAVVMVNRAILCLKQGEVDQAETLARDAERILAASGHDVFVGYTEQLRSVVALWRRDHETARSLMAAARARFDAHDARDMVLDCDARAVEALIHGGDPATAVERARDLRAQLDAAGPDASLTASVFRLQAMAMLRAGDADGALAAATEAVTQCRQVASPFELALSLDALAHAQNGTGTLADSSVLAERDELLGGLGVRRTLFPLAR